MGLGQGQQTLGHETLHPGMPVIRGGPPGEIPPYAFLDFHK
jgi:hypothetical protein